MSNPPARMTHAIERSPTARKSRSGADSRHDAPATRRTRRRAVAACLSVLTLGAAVLTSSPALAYTCGPTDTLATGQQKINQGNYWGAIDTFTCVMNANPLTVDAYRGRAEARVLLGQYAEAYHDLYALSIGTIQPSDVDDMVDTILASYEQRLDAAPWDVPALTGASFAYWSFWQYPDAIPRLDQLLTLDPNNVYARLFRGSNRLFAGVNIAAAEGDLDAALALAPQSADVRFVVADAYTYALPDLPRAYDEASLALSWGLDTPRIHAILAAALDDEGDRVGAASHIQTHIQQVTSQNVNTTALGANSSMTVNLVAWRTFQVPIQATKGQLVSIRTSSTSYQVWDTILVVLDSSGHPVISSDDHVGFFAGLDWVPSKSGTYTMRVTSFEGINKGPLTVTRY